jgi:hypothetical protein
MRVLPVLRFVFLAAWLCAGQALAQDEALYEGESMVDSQSEEQRAAALPRALGQVLVKVTGDPGAAGDPAFSRALGNAARMVQQYRYREDVVNVGGAPQLRSFLIARFNPQSVDELVAGAGRTVWPAPRPKPLLWLAIDDGRGPRLVGEAQQNAVSSLTRRANERGLVVTFPLGDAQDQTLGGPQAVWRDDVAAVRDAAVRYGHAPVLIGKLRRGGAGWQADWVLIDGGTELHRWSASDANAAMVLAAGADGAASTLSKHFSTRILSGPAGDYEVLVLGLADGDDYGRLLAYLKRVAIVRRIEPLQASGDTLRLELGLSSGVEGLSRLVAGGGVLRPLETPVEGVPAFQLEP